MKRFREIGSDPVFQLACAIFAFAIFNWPLSSMFMGLQPIGSYAVIYSMWLSMTLVLYLVSRSILSSLDERK